MKKTGTTSITNELTLKDFTWEISGVLYDWKKNKASIQILMKEFHYEHERSFIFDCAEEWTSAMCLEKILSLEQFKGSI